MGTPLKELVDRINEHPDRYRGRAVLHRRRLAISVYVMARALVQIFSKKHGRPEDYRLMARTALEKTKWWTTCSACHDKVRQEEQIRREEHDKQNHDGASATPLAQRNGSETSA